MLLLQPKSKKTKIIVAAVILIVIVLLLLVTLTSGVRTNLSLPERMTKGFIAPVRAGFSIVWDKMQAVPNYFSGISSLQAKNDELQTEIYNLQNTINGLLETQYENERLRDLLDMKTRVETQFQPKVSKVIGRSSNYWYNTLTIEGGQDCGYTVNMPVVNAYGLVGRLTYVDKKTSEVLLITDKNGAAGAMLQNSRTVGVVESDDRESGMLSMIHVPYEAEVAENQTVITSGLGGVYPSGLLIGYVVAYEPEPGGLMLRLTVQPFVDFDRIEEVLVLMPKGDEGAAK